MFYFCQVSFYSLVPKTHDDVIKWKHCPSNWPFVRGINRSSVNSPHKSQWRGALMFTLICAGINGWVNIRKAGDLRRYHDHYDVIVMVVLLVHHHPCNIRGPSWSSGDITAVRMKMDAVVISPPLELTNALGENWQRIIESQLPWV